MNPLKISIAENSILKIDGDRRSTIISCERGMVSVTQYNDSEDHILSADDCFIVNRRGRVLAWALSDSSLEIVLSDSRKSGLIGSLRRLISL